MLPLGAGQTAAVAQAVAQGDLPVPLVQHFEFGQVGNNGLVQADFTLLYQLHDGYCAIDFGDGRHIIGAVRIRRLFLFAALGSDGIGGPDFAMAHNGVGHRSPALFQVHGQDGRQLLGQRLVHVLSFSFVGEARRPSPVFCLVDGWAKMPAAGSLGPKKFGGRLGFVSAGTPGGGVFDPRFGFRRRGPFAASAFAWRDIEPPRPRLYYTTPFWIWPGRLKFYEKYEKVIHRGYEQPVQNLCG
jgi:hypothetical protein